MTVICFEGAVMEVKSEMKDERYVKQACCFWQKENGIPYHKTISYPSFPVCIYFPSLTTTAAF